jgi:UDP-glucose 4-epimerase
MNAPRSPAAPEQAAHRILVVGAAGFIGSHLCTTLTSRGHHVTGLVRPGSVAPAGLATVESELDDGEALAEVLADLDIDGVCHCAWVRHPRSAGTRYGEQAHTSVMPALQLAIAAGMAGVAHVVFVSSGGGLNPPTATEPPTAYGWAKRSVEALLDATAHDFGFGLTVLRPTAVYGPGQDPAKGLGAVTVFLRAILTGQPVHIYGSPSSGRDFLHVEDLVDCVAAVLEREVTGTFDVGGPEVVTLEQLVRNLERALDRRADLRIDNPTGFDPQLVCLDNTAVTTATGWRPTRRLVDAIPELLRDAAQRLAAEGTSRVALDDPLDDPVDAAR